jgi:hypothetical protein
MATSCVFLRDELLHGFSNGHVEEEQPSVIAVKKVALSKYDAGRLDGKRPTGLANGPRSGACRRLLRRPGYPWLA